MPGGEGEDEPSATPTRVTNGIAIDVADATRNRCVFVFTQPMTDTFVHEIGHHLFLPHARGAGGAVLAGVHDVVGVRGQVERALVDQRGRGCALHPDHPVSGLPQRRDLFGPGLAGERPPVDEHHGAAVTTGVVDVQAGVPEHPAAHDDLPHGPGMPW